jgi:YkoY family integral membrane protein
LDHSQSNKDEAFHLRFNQKNIYLMLENIINYFTNVGVEIYFLLLILVVLEAVLSADNAIALAAIAKSVKEPKLQRQALNIGLVGAYILRIILILAATWVVKYWQFELLGAIYLLWLVVNYFLNTEADTETSDKHTLNFKSLWQVIPTIAITDLAFSLDSVTSAIAITEDTWLIIAGGTIGIIILRFLAGLFIRWLQEYTYLEDAGFITVGFVGLRLLLKVWLPDAMIPEWVTIAVVALFFSWGFSKREESEQ